MLLHPLMPSRLCHHAALSNRNRRIGGGSEGGRKTLTFLLCSLPCALYVLILIFDCLSFFPSCFLFVLCVFVFALGFVSFVSLFCGGWSRPLFVQGFKAESMVGSPRFVEVETGASSPLDAQQIVPPRCFVELGASSPLCVPSRLCHHLLCRIGDQREEKGGGAVLPACSTCCCSLLFSFPFSFFVFRFFFFFFFFFFFGF